MSRILQIARREFVSTALTKGFIIGAFVVPAVIVLLIPVLIRLTMQAEPPKVAGTVVVVDRSGAVLDGITRNLSPDAIRERRGQVIERVTRALGEGGAEPAVPGGAEAAAAVVAGRGVPDLAVLGLESGGDVEAQKETLRSEGADEGDRRLAVIVIDADAVRLADGAERFGSFELFVRPRLDDRIIDEIREGVREAIRAARYDEYSLDAAWIERVSSVGRGRTVEVTAAGERSSAAGLNVFLPMVFMFLLMISVMIGSQYLLTTTIEEKSSRVVEVLLSAVSPMQLMTGKVLGQMLVGLSLLVIYSGLGMGVLAALAMSDIVSPAALAYLVVFFILEYFMLAALTAAVGSAVNEFREAQSLQTPIMLVVMVPYFLWLPLSRDPNALWATVLSFVPPISPFVMIIRITSTDPPPAWQPLLAIGVNAVAAYAFVWMAAKVFRIGLLMYGKPPNLATLLRWVRMA